jgi:nitric oxide reductase NorE protein
MTARENPDHLPGDLMMWVLIISELLVWEYASLSALGHGLDDTAFFTFYFLLTGFHAAHVAAGIVILGLVGWKLSLRNAETGVAFWHMVDLVWVLLFPVIYLLP